MDNEALALWKEWFDNNNYIAAPVAYDCSGFPHCFFCNRHNPILNGHEKDCIYIRAKELVRGPAFQGLRLREGNNV